ncbi:hypothetical protein EVAR_73043_1 [Eumeta japonica]|uniref:Uncharacterized protein n=1 Tax=Eumeta variegata TaxID=151549 RepID=A0A4C1SJV4_EUMVA|nr:hypothetical protein EVAR_73043_1 [Eumeta japonica]
MTLRCLAQQLSPDLQTVTVKGKQGGGLRLPLATRASPLRRARIDALNVLDRKQIATSFRGPIRLLSMEPLRLKRHCKMLFWRNLWLVTWTAVLVYVAPARTQGKADSELTNRQRLDPSTRGETFLCEYKQRTQPGVMHNAA